MADGASFTSVVPGGARQRPPRQKQKLLQRLYRSKNGSPARAGSRRSAASLPATLLSEGASGTQRWCEQEAALAGGAAPVPEESAHTPPHCLRPCRDLDNRAQSFAELEAAMAAAVRPKARGAAAPTPEANGATDGARSASSASSAIGAIGADGAIGGDGAAAGALADWELFDEGPRPLTNFRSQVAQDPLFGELGGGGFLYLVPRQGDRPYDLRLVRAAEVSDYAGLFYVYSRHSILRHYGGETEVLGVLEFEREVYIYLRLVQKPFFFFYHSWKCFTEWKKWVRRRKRRRAMRNLQERLFILDPLLREGILYMRSVCEDMSMLRIYRLDKHATVSVTDFVDRQRVAKENVLAELSAMAHDMRERMLHLARSSLDDVLHANGFRQGCSLLSETGPRSDLDAQSESDRTASTIAGATPVEADDAWAFSGGGGGAPSIGQMDMTFTERATMRTHCKRITAFIRLVDFFVVDAYMSISLGSVDALQRHLRHAHRAMSDEQVRGIDVITDSVRPQSHASARRAPWPSRPAAKADAAKAEEPKDRRVLPVVTVELMLDGGADGLSMDARRGGPEAAEAIARRVYRTVGADGGGSGGDVMRMLRCSPSEGDLKRVFEDAIFDGLGIVTEIPRLLLDGALADFVGPTGEELGLLSDGLDLEMMIVASARFRFMLDDISACLSAAYGRVRTFSSKLRAHLERYVSNLAFMSGCHLEAYDGVSLKELRKLLGHYQAEMEENERLKVAENVGLFRVDSKKVDGVLRPSPSDCLVFLNKLLPDMYNQRSKALAQELSAANDRANARPQSVDEYVYLVSFLRDAADAMPDVDDRYSFLAELYTVMEEFRVRMSDELRSSAVMLSNLVANTKLAINAAEELCEEQTKRFKKKFSVLVEALHGRIEEVAAASAAEAVDSGAAGVADAIGYLEDLDGKLGELRSLADKYLHYQSVLREKVFDDRQLRSVEHRAGNKLLVWRSIEEWADLVDVWKDLDFADVDVRAVEQDVRRFWKIAGRVGKALPQHEAVELLRAQIDVYRRVLPAARSLKEEALEGRHWQQAHAVLGYRVQGKDAITFGDLVARDPSRSAAQLGQLAMRAQGERKLRAMLSRVTAAWEHRELPMVRAETSGNVKKLDAVEDLIAQLEETSVTLATILNSQYVGPIREEAERWMSTFTLLHGTIEEWTRCQERWLYITSVFASPDVQKQLPVETKAFHAVEVSMREIMRRTADDPHCIRAGTVQGLTELFQHHNATLERVQKGLEDYLEVKRARFPRFYFLSNDELLLILGSSGTPQATQRYLCKCFNGVGRFDFGEAAATTPIDGMVSHEGERVAFGPNLKARGSVEEWMAQLVDTMRRVMVKATKAALQEDPGAATPALSAHPAQCVALAQAAAWASQLEAALRAADAHAALRGAHEAAVSRLARLAADLRGGLAPLARRLCVGLLTAAVHQRDVAGLLAALPSPGEASFEWVSQVRPAWNRAREEVEIRHMDLVTPYGYEYHGVTQPLVVTPLTERCWLTLTAALHARAGALCSGPAGTGKTETVKGLCVALGAHYIVFSASPQVDHKVTARLLTGLCQCGAWCILDDVDRVAPDVLSIFAQQMATIAHARRAAPGGAALVDLDGKEIRAGDFHVVATINPGYPGRSPAVGSLAHGFRPVAMAEPHLERIAEVTLLARGFAAAPALARRAVALYALGRQRLAHLRSCDFGLRALKDVLLATSALRDAAAAAGAWPAEGEAAREEALLLRAIYEANGPQLPGPDREAFDGLVADAFGRAPGPPPRSPRAEASSLGLGKLPTAAPALSAAQAEKVLQLREMLEMRAGAAIVGAAASGKTSIYAALAAEAGVQRTVIDPGSLTLAELFGAYRPSSHEWGDGTATAAIRRAAAAPAAAEQWIVFDGCVDCAWADSLNTVLDDHRVLCLPSSERLTLGRNLRFLLECADLDSASPATVSRLGIVHVDGGLFRLERLFEDNVRRLLAPPDAGLFAEPSAAAAADAPDLSARLVAHLVARFRAMGEPLIHFATAHGGGGFAATPAQLVDSVCAIFRSLVHLNRGAFDAMADGEDKLRVADQVFAFALVWGLGGALADADQISFDIFFRDLLSETGCDASVLLPGGGTVFDYFLRVSAKDPEDPFQDGAEDDAADAARPTLPPRFAAELSGARATAAEQEALAAAAATPALHARWETWESLLRPFRYDEGLHVADLMVPTGPSLAVGTLLGVLSAARRPVLVSGAAGCGKTVTVKDFVKRYATPVDAPALRAEAFAGEPLGDIGLEALPVHTTFSAHTTAAQLRFLLGDRLIRKRKTLLCAPEGKANMLIVDDLNMPAPEPSGANPPLAVLRELAERGGFHEPADLAWKEVRGTLLTAIAANPGGGRCAPPARLLRHFAQLCMPTPHRERIAEIYATFLTAFGAHHLAGVDLKAVLGGVVAALSDTYDLVVERFRPSPLRPHYLFSIRDAGRIVEGLVAGARDDLCAAEPLARLWAHEARRVFGDRLGDEAEVRWLEEVLCDMVTRHMHLSGWSAAEVFRSAESPFLFADWVDDGGGAERQYRLCPSRDALLAQAQLFMAEHNAQSHGDLELVLFLDALSHVARITRVLRRPRGSLLLIGTSGCGRESLTRLAAHICECDFFAPRDHGGQEPSRAALERQASGSEDASRHEAEAFPFSAAQRSFREDLKAAVFVAGTEDVEVLFFMKDRHAAEECHLEDMSALVNHGEVPGLFNATESAEIVERLRGEVLKRGAVDSPPACRRLFRDRVRQRLHVVLGVAPYGGAVARLSRSFPALLSALTVDWVWEWREDALETVAAFFVEGSGALDPPHQAAAVALATKMHRDAKAAADAPGAPPRVVSKLFLDLMHAYVSRLDEEQQRRASRRAALEAAARRLDALREESDGFGALLAERAALAQRAGEEAEALRAEVEAMENAVSAAEGELVRLEAASAALLEAVATAQARSEAETQLESLRAKLFVAEKAVADQRRRAREASEALAAPKWRLDRAAEDKARRQEELGAARRRVENAAVLLEELSAPRERWIADAERLEAEGDAYLGDSLLFAAFTNYLGALAPAQRAALAAEWRRDLLAAAIPSSPAEPPGAGARPAFLRLGASDVDVEDWTAGGLPADGASLENATIALCAPRYPLMVDPDGLALRWIRRIADQKLLLVADAGAPNLAAVLEDALRSGKTLVLDRTGERLPPLLDPVLHKKLYHENEEMMMAVGGRKVRVSPDFRLFLCCRLHRPAFAPDVHAKVAVVRFDATFEGLRAQLLADAASVRLPQEEDRRASLLAALSADARLREAMDDRVLHLAQRADGDLLEDADFTASVADAERAASAVRDRLERSRTALGQADELRGALAPVAARGAVFFFAVGDVSAVNPMYRHSQQSFRALFRLCLQRQAAAGDGTAAVLDGLTRDLFHSVSRGLFRAHRPILALRVALRVQGAAGGLTLPQARALLRPRPPPRADDAADELERLSADAAAPRAAACPAAAAGDSLLDACSAVQGLDDLPRAVAEDEAAWAAWASAPADAPIPPLPHDALRPPAPFLRLLVARALRPEAALPAAAAYVASVMGEGFLSAPPSDHIGGAFEAMDARTPCLLITRGRADPLGAILSMGAAEGAPAVLVCSLGGGEAQAERAAALVERGRRIGAWVVLQNLQLSPAFLPRLGRLLAAGAEHSPRFRLFLASAVAPAFPLAVLERCVRVSCEAPRSVRCAMARLLDAHLSPQRFAALDARREPKDGDAGSVGSLAESLRFGLDRIAEGKEAEVRQAKAGAARLWQLLSASLALFHATLLARGAAEGVELRRLPPVCDADFSSGLDMLQRHVESLRSEAPRAEEATPSARSLRGQRLQEVRVLDAALKAQGADGIGERIARVVYCASAKDDAARARVLETLRRTFRPADALLPDREGYAADGGAAPYAFPKQQALTHAALRESVAAWPTTDAPRHFGVDGGAAERSARRRSDDFLSDDAAIPVIEAQTWAPGAEEPPQMAGAAGNAAEELQRVVAVLLRSLPEPPRAPSAAPAAGRGADPSAEVVAGESGRLCCAIDAARSCLAAIEATGSGGVLDGAARRCADGLARCEVPDEWVSLLDVGRRGLAEWWAALARRAAYFQRWLGEGAPRTVRLDAFQRPQAFLTSVLQAAARRRRCSVGDVRLRAEVLSDGPLEVDAPADGVILTGLRLRAAVWDGEAGALGEAPAVRGDAAAEMPPILVAPESAAGGARSAAVSFPVYRCRAGEAEADLVWTFELPTSMRAEHCALVGACLTLEY